MKSNIMGIVVWPVKLKRVSNCGREEGIYTRNSFPESPRGKVLDRDTLIDGELVTLDENSRPSFNLLQHFRSKASAIQYYVFDLIFYRGKSLLEVPLDTRRKLLTQAIRSLEGIIAKRKDSYYESGKRSGAWAKYKVNKSQEFVIRGYTPGNPIDAITLAITKTETFSMLKR
jgi:bifunctional non-homologous end joining protein LigD